MVLRLRQHSIGYTGDGFYRSKDPTNSIKVMTEHTNNRISAHRYNALTCIVFQILTHKARK